MTDPLASALTQASVGLGVVALGSLAIWALDQAGPEEVCEVRFPEDLAASQVEALLRQVASGRPRPLTLTLDAHAGTIHYYLSASGALLRDVSAALSGLAPRVRLDEATLPEMSPVRVTRLGWSGPWPLLDREHPEALVAGLLGALSDGSRSGHLRLVLRFTPARRPGSPRAAGTSGQLPGEQARAIRLKASGPLLKVEIVLAVQAENAPAARALAERVIAALRAMSGLRGRLRSQSPRLRRPESVLASSTSLGGLRTILSPAEAVPLTGWPIEAPQVTGIGYGVGPRLAPPQHLPARGRRFGTSSFPATASRGIYQEVEGALSHTAIVGPTGSGKSSLVANLVLQDVEAGRGVLVIDGKGDLVDDLLARLPDRRRDDVVLLDPSREDLPQPGIRLFSRTGDPELTADVVLGTLASLFADSWGIRSAQYLRLGLVTLAAWPGATLLELPLLFGDARVRSEAIRHVRDPLVVSAWQRFAALSAADQATQIAPALTKLEQLISRRSLRGVLGQTQPKLVFSEAIARARVVLVRLPRGLMGAAASQLLAALTLWGFVQAVEARAALPQERRRPFLLYLDELSALGALPLPLDDLLERARGLGVGLTLSPQSLSQLAPALRQTVLANVGSLVAFRQRSSEEAAALARELPGVRADQLQHLDPFEIALRLGLRHGVTTPVMTAFTSPLPEPIRSGDALAAHAAERFGAPIDEVDAAFAARHGITAPTDSAQPSMDEGNAIGQRRRTS